MELAATLLPGVHPLQRGLRKQLAAAAEGDAAKILVLQRLLLQHTNQVIVVVLSIIIIFMDRRANRLRFHVRSDLCYDVARVREPLGFDLRQLVASHLEHKGLSLELWQSGIQD